MDLTESIVPRSDQINSDDLIAHPVTVTISEVRAGKPEQPVEVHLAEFPGRPYKPSKSMRRVMVQAWGAEAEAYVGRRLTLFRNPEIMFGRDKVGGIEISHLSNLPKRLTVSLMVTRGKRKPFSVDPLPDATPAPTTPRDWRTEAAALTGNTDALRALWIDAKAQGVDDETLTHISNKAKEATV